MGFRPYLFKAAATAGPSINFGSSTAISTASKPIDAIFGKSSSADAVVKGEVQSQVLAPNVTSKLIVRFVYIYFVTRRMPFMILQ
jgi:hypothetical protein